MNSDFQKKYQASIDFLKIYSPEYQAKLQKLIWQAPIDQRSQIWRKENVPYKEIEKVFIKLTEQRNAHAKENGFKSNLEYFLNLYKVSERDYCKLINRFKKAVNYCNLVSSDGRKLPRDFYSEFGNHCYFCLIDEFPIKSLKDAESLVYEFDKSIFSLRNKIMIINDNASFSKRNKDRFEIHVDKNQNIRHQSIDLIHELFHLNNGELQNKYQREKEVASLEIAFYKKFNSELYKALFGEFLKVFHRTSFEIELYENPNQDLSKLYANVFNRCYKGAHQSKNRSYILDDLIIRYPFQNLPHTLAQIDAISTPID